MDEYESLSHSKWECKYHVVFIPKCRRRTLYEELRRHLGELLPLQAMSLYVCRLSPLSQRYSQNHCPNTRCCRWHLMPFLGVSFEPANAPAATAAALHMFQIPLTSRGLITRAPASMI
jgi:hypothetical protein